MGEFTVKQIKKEVAYLPLLMLSNAYIYMRFYIKKL